MSVFSSFLRQGVSALCLSGLIGVYATPVIAGESESILISVERARVMRLPAGTQTLIIGNPIVADITLLRAQSMMVITGRSFGATNLIALDGAGNQIDELIVKVTTNNQALIVRRGDKQESYSCNPRCEATVALGDDQSYMKATLNSSLTMAGAALALTRGPK